VDTTEAAEERDPRAETPLLPPLYTLRQPPRDWRWVVGGVGKVLIATGLLMFAFVGYQLWGTGIEHAQDQRQLKDEFREKLALVSDTIAISPSLQPTLPSVSLADPSSSSTTVPPTTVPPTVALPPVELGDAVAVLEIPRIDVTQYVVAGVRTADLKRGVGHFPDTPMPGQFGNAALAGHRTTYGAPFFDVDQLAPGDEIKVTTLFGSYVYRVTGTQIVSPSDYQVIATTSVDEATLTLVSCHPRYTARERIIVSAALDTELSSVPLPATVRYGAPASDEPADSENTFTPPDESTPSSVAEDEGGDAAGTTLDPSEPVAGEGDDRPSPPTDPAGVDDGGSLGLSEDSDSAELLQQGWFSDPNAWPHVAAWGAVLSAIALFSWALSLSTRRNWLGFLAGLGPFVIVLYFFFQNVNRLLPPNL
jgi:sortase A